MGRADVKRFGITAIITTIAMTSLIAIAVAILFLSFKTQEKIFSERFQDTLKYTSLNLSADLLPHVVEGPSRDIQMIELLLRLDVYKGIVGAAIIDLDRSVLVAYRGASYTSEVNEDTYISLTESMPIGVNRRDDRLIALQSIGEPDHPIAYLLVIENISTELAAVKSEIIGEVALPFLVIFTLLSLSTIWALHRFSSPINRLAKTILHVATTKNYSLKAPLAGVAEARILASNFNRLLSEMSLQLGTINRNNEELAAQRDKMRILANEDMLTGLPNRQFIYSTLSEDLKRAQQAGDDFEVLFFDLDGFKEVNDSLGHETGDLLLMAVAERVSSILQGDDLFARLGGDEFLIRTFHCGAKATGKELSERILDAFDMPLQVSQWSLSVGASIGVSSAAESDYELNTLIRHADIAMFESKLNGKNRSTRFTDEMESASKRRQLLGKLIQSAIDNQEFSLVYQPRVNSNGETQSYEALVRWNNKKLGWISPAEFIPIAEQAGHITKLSAWVIQQVCTDIKTLLARSETACRVSINLSSIDVQDQGFIEKALKIIELNDVQYGHIEFEITETAYLANIESAQLFCKRVKELGCHVALDDFGTGYSSLSYLTKIDIDTLKIDRQFVANMTNSDRSFVVIEAIMVMAKRLGLSVCAEGVETEEQAEVLRELACDEMQGYFFSKPKPLEALVQEP